MAYTPTNNPYIPGDPYSYDLKWIVKQIKAWKDPLNSAEEAKASAEMAAESSQLAEEAAERAEAAAASVIRKWTTPEEFGAVGDGITDDTAAFQNALNVENVAIICQSKYYKITDTLRLKSNTFINLNGAEIISTVKHLFTNFTPTDTFNAYNGHGNIAIINGNIVGGSIGFWHGSNIIFENVNFKNCINDHFIELCAIQNIKIVNCTFIGMITQVGYSAEYEYINIDPNTTTPSTYFMGREYPAGNYDGTKCNGIFINNCYFNINENDNIYNKMTNAIGCHSPIGQYHNDIVIRNCLIKNCENMALRIGDMQNVIISDNKIDMPNNGNYAITMLSPDGGVNSPGAKNVDIVNNIIKMKSYCLQAVSPVHLTFQNNYCEFIDGRRSFVEFSGSFAEHIVIENNTSNYNNYAAFRTTFTSLNAPVFDALQLTWLPGFGYNSNTRTITSSNFNFTEFRKLRFAFGTVSAGTYYTLDFNAWVDHNGILEGVSYPLLIGDTGNTLLSFMIDPTNKNQIILTPASGFNMGYPVGMFVAKEK